MYIKYAILTLCLFFSGLLDAQQTVKIDLRQLVEGEFNARSVYGLRSMNDGLHYTVIENNNEIVQYSYKTGKKIKTVFNTVNSGVSSLKRIDDYHFSSDEKKILIETKKENIYRHSYKAVFFVYNIETQKLERLTKEGKVQLAIFSPQADKIAFVKNNNIYYKDLLSGKMIQVTQDGEYNHIINGAPDWVYEEEFSFYRGYAWSPDGKYLFYYRFDESKVKQFSFTMFKGEAPEYKENKVYSSEYKFKYPKAGENNSIVSIHTYHLPSKTHTKMYIGENNDQYIPRVSWTKDPKKLAIIRLNRHQNHYSLLLADAINGKSKVIYEEKNKAWVSINDDLTFLENGKHFILSSEKDGYNHLYLYDIKGNIVNQITKGEWEVTRYLGVDQKKGLVYYESTEQSSLNRNIYSIGLNGKNKKIITPNKGTNRVEFSKTFKYYINYFSNVNTPYQVTLHNRKGKQIRKLEANTKLKEKLDRYQLPQKEFFQFTTSEGIRLNAWVLKPYDFDPSKKYAALLYIYGGPGSQTVLNRWEFNWFQYLAENGIIVYSVDNRGTGGRGEAFKKSTYMQLQNLEALDLIETAKYIKKQPYIKKNKLAVYGWSFGGQMSSLCMFRGADVFDVGIAVAPVTNYRYYDNIYSERYLRTPQENPEGYDKYAAVTHAHKLKGKYLLIHGMADDNVHFQNAAELAEILVQQNKQFDMFYYTNRNHSIYGGNTRLHLFTKMVNFLFEHLK